MKKAQNPLAFLFILLGFVCATSSCDTIRQKVEVPASTGFKKEDIVFKWKLIAGKVTAPLTIPDIFDATNPLISGNPAALAAICTKNAITEFKADDTFSEISNCYTPLGAGNNPQNGTYIFTDSESSINTTYNNASTFPTVLIGRKVTIKSINKTSNPHKMTVEYKTKQGALDVITEFIYEKQTGFTQQEISFNWKLTAGKVTSPLSIPDIFDTSNPLISGNPTALAAVCTKNSVIEFKANNTFTETSSCYIPLGTGNNPQNGTYIFNQAEGSITISYTNASTFPTLLVGRKVVIKSISGTPTKMIVSYATNQSGIDIITEFTYEKQP